MNTQSAIQAIQSKSRVSLFIKTEEETYGHGELIQLIYGLIHQGAIQIDGVSIENNQPPRAFNLTHDVVVNGPNINELFQASGNIKFIDVHFANQ